MFYYLWCRLCVSSFGPFPSFPFFLSDPWFFHRCLYFLRRNPLLLVSHVLYHKRCTSGEGVHGWCGDVPGLIRVFTQACDLTSQPDYRFRIPVQLLFPQGTGELSSADHTWIISCNCDFDLAVCPPPYVQKRFFPFICHGSTQLREYNQGFSP